MITILPLGHSSTITTTTTYYTTHSLPPPSPPPPPSASSSTSSRRGRGETLPDPVAYQSLESRSEALLHLSAAAVCRGTATGPSLLGKPVGSLLPPRTTLHKSEFTHFDTSTQFVGETFTSHESRRRRDS
ncbi:unnamed protein product [Protopolystoma xenopodis]|uniref:Uncharacterized protein n=1 Tax=Protopolystoma xenopodis TaxID=117903 RepID=A0A3S5APV3_9PLAT|nr:unnamed protein product [Protopolystoma xenopodis]